MKCEHFPIVDTLEMSQHVKNRLCIVTHESHPHHEAYRRHVLSLATTGQFEQPAPVEVGQILKVTDRQQDRGPEIRRGEPPSQAVPLELYRERLERVNLCVHRSPLDEQPSCGCNPLWNCALGKGTFRSKPHEVSQAECLECVAAADDEAPIKL